MVYAMSVINRVETKKYDIIFKDFFSEHRRKQRKNYEEPSMIYGIKSLILI